MNFEEIWSEYRASLKLFLHSKISSPDEVDDLLQEILIKIYKNLSAVKSEGSVKSWLFQVANHTIIDFYRKRAKLNKLPSEELWYSEENDEVEQSLSQCVIPFINALSLESAELLTAIDLKGQSQVSYAEEHRISYSTLKSRVQKARRELRTLFEDCCHFTLDSRGNIADFEEKSKSCENC